MIRYYVGVSVGIIIGLIWGYLFWGNKNGK
jgi:hypothetical protein